MGLRLTPCVFAMCAVVSAGAHAEIYAWVDGEGHMTLSDHVPPPGARVVEVVSEPSSAAAPVPRTARDDSANATIQDAKVQRLTQRVQQLEQQLAATQSAPQYAPPAAPQYSAATPALPYGCQYWADCGPWWSTPAYPVTFGVVAVPARRFHHFHHARGMHLRHR
jgi:hypothetical protein